MRHSKQFYLTYQKCQTLSGKLSWSHYCELLSISDPDKRSFYEKEVFCSPRTSFAKYFLHAYQLCASQHGAVFSASLELHSVFCCHAVVCFGLFKDHPAVDRQTASRRPFVAWLHSHQHIYCILCRVHSRLVRIILTKKTGAVGRTYSSGLSFYVTKR